jgi:hypothetical protein
MNKFQVRRSQSLHHRQKILFRNDNGLSTVLFDKQNFEIANIRQIVRRFAHRSAALIGRRSGLTAAGATPSFSRFATKSSHSQRVTLISYLGFPTIVKTFRQC